MEGTLIFNIDKNSGELMPTTSSRAFSDFRTIAFTTNSLRQLKKLLSRKKGIINQSSYTDLFEGERYLVRHLPQFSKFRKCFQFTGIYVGKKFFHYHDVPCFQLSEKDGVYVYLYEDILGGDLMPDTQVIPLKK